MDILIKILELFLLMWAVIAGEFIFTIVFGLIFMFLASIIFKNEPPQFEPSRFVKIFFSSAVWQTLLEISLYCYAFAYIFDLIIVSNFRLIAIYIAIYYLIAMFFSTIFSSHEDNENFSDEEFLENEQAEDDMKKRIYEGGLGPVHGMASISIAKDLFKKTSFSLFSILGFLVSPIGTLGTNIIFIYHEIFNKKPE